ncbi:MAG: hypothetical protein U1F77_16845 [Kiritimatiellia bacterium]
MDVLSSDAVGIAPGARVLLEHRGRPPAPLSACATSKPGPSPSCRRWASRSSASTSSRIWRAMLRRSGVWATASASRPASRPGRPPACCRSCRQPFRQKDDWAVFVAGLETAALRIVKIGHRNDRQAELLAGLAVGRGRVVLHPTDRLVDGGRITAP